MKRADALRAMTFAGYHGDAATFTGLLIEARVARAKAREAFRAGEQAKARGIRCGCPECKGTTNAR